jgi:hypothetical protein
LRDVPSGRWLELQVGDGLVGSLGVWLETIAQERGWIFEAWEHRAWPAVSFRKNRPLKVLHVGRLTSWTDTNVAGRPVGITTRGVREAAGACRANCRQLKARQRGSKLQRRQGRGMMSYEGGQGNVRCDQEAKH